MTNDKNMRETNMESVRETEREWQQEKCSVAVGVHKSHAPYIDVVCS